MLNERGNRTPQEYFYNSTEPTVVNQKTRGAITPYQDADLDAELAPGGGTFQQN